MTLRIFDEAVVYVRRMRPVVEMVARRDAGLADQLRRALASVLLNTAEGARQRRGKGRNRFEDAMGSADEARACHITADAMGYVVADAALLDEANRVARVLYKLAR
jgi:four helix bundle protein